MDATNLSRSQQEINRLQFNAVNRQNKPKIDTTPKPLAQKRISPPASRSALVPRLEDDEERPQRVSPHPERTPGGIIRQHSSARLAKMDNNTPPGSTRPDSDAGSHVSARDNASVRSWASVGMGSTDGKKMIIRRVPTTPVELFNIVNPPT